MGNIDNRLKEILIENTRVQVISEQIDDTTDLINELALDSILIVNLLVDLEEEFTIEIRVQDWKKPILNQFRDLKEYIEELLSERQATIPTEAGESR